MAELSRRVWTSGGQGDRHMSPRYREDPRMLLQQLVQFVNADQTEAPPGALRIQPAETEGLRRISRRTIAGPAARQTRTALRGDLGAGGVWGRHEVLPGPGHRCPSPTGAHPRPGVERGPATRRGIRRLLSHPQPNLRGGDLEGARPAILGRNPAALPRDDQPVQEPLPGVRLPRAVSSCAASAGQARGDLGPGRSPAASRWVG